MLVLTRLVGQSIKIDGPCVIQLNWIRGPRAAFGIEADREVKILRTELEGVQEPKPEGQKDCGQPHAA